MARPTHRWAEADLADLRERALLRTLTPLRSAQGPVVELSDGQRLLNFSSNDYLGLAADPLLIAAAKEGLTRWGLGSGASRLVVGDFEPHGALEVALARFERSEAVRVFNSGYAANSSLVPGLVGAGDAVFSDALNHASLIDGCRLSRAEVLVYPHGEVDALEVQLGRSAARRKLVVTDTVFSMDGDVAALPALVAACEQNGAALLVDEAHATGVLGERGAGACEALGVEDRVDLRMGTLSKALGGMGAYVATSRAVAELLVSRARPLIFSTALPAAWCVAAERAVRLVQEEPQRRERLWRHIRRFAEGLRALGHPAQARSAIFPLVLGDAEKALQASEQLRERGLLVKAIRPPTVPAGTSRLRFTLSAAHTEAHVEEALHAIAAL